MNQTQYNRDLRFPGLDPAAIANQGCAVDVGNCIREIRKERGLSLRSLAYFSGLSVNTLSLIETGKSSPSVHTLQKIAEALRIPIVALFLSKKRDQKIVHTSARQRQRVTMTHGTLEDLGTSLSSGAPEPFIVTLTPFASSGTEATMHLGYEFVFCLAGRVEYRIQNQSYILDPGDSLFFEACLPHRWQNLASGVSKILMILCPASDHEYGINRHFSPE